MFVAGTQLLRHHLQLPRMAVMLSKQVTEAPSEKVVPRQRCEAGGGDNHAISGKKIFQRRQRSKPECSRKTEYTQLQCMKWGAVRNEVRKVLGSQIP